MQRTCVKCGHSNLQADGGAGDACPQCGAIYAKATATGVRPVQRAAQSGFGVEPGRFADVSSPAAEQHAAPREFVARMRAQSLYPTVRTLVTWTHWFMVFIAVVLGGLSVLQWRTMGPFALFVGLGLAAFILIMSLAVREVSLMLADLADASVRAAAVAEAER